MQQIYIKDFDNKKSRNLINFESIINEFKKHEFQLIFKQIFILLKIYLSVPISSAGCERSFSCLKRVKTYLRSTMGQARLSSLAIINIESDCLKLININDIIDCFSKGKYRRLDF